MPAPELIEQIDDALPQTQCRRCGYADCRAYAQAVADGEQINRCPPGGAEGVRRLANLTGREPIALDASCGVESARRVAVIDEAACIGCTLCMQACPVDAIAGAPKRMHSVLADWCTGCELCLPPCPTDCIDMQALPTHADATGWQAWSAEQAALARGRHRQRSARLAEQAASSAPLAASGSQGAGATGSTADAAQARKRALVRAALERAQARQASRRA